MKGYAEMCTLFLCLGGRSWVTKVKGVQLEQMGAALVEIMYGELLYLSYLFCE
jgi:hypothetical protein